MVPQITRQAAAAPINNQAQPGRPLDPEVLFVPAAAAPAAAAAPGWPDEVVDVTVAGVVAGWVSVVVVVCGDAVTVSVFADVVTVFVCADAVTVFVGADAVTV